MKIAAALLFCLSVTAWGQELMPGSAAPAISVKTWVKGKPIPKLEKGKTYVVEFWATWCGPCIENIPHLTDLAKKYPNIPIVGVGIWEDNADKRVEAFVKSMGAKMDYHVAYSGNKDGMAKTWMAPAGQSGIPASFVVQDGKIAWIGHPFQLDGVLKKVSEGTFDVAEAKKNFIEARARYEAQRKFNDGVAACEAQFDQGDRDGARRKLDELAKANPAGGSVVAELRFKWLAVDDYAAWQKGCTERIAKSEDERNTLSFFCNANATKLEMQVRWLIEQVVVERERPNWYPHLNTGRAYRQLKEYDKALKHIAASRQIILDFQKAHPEEPKGNALEILGRLEEDVLREKGK